MQEFHKSWFQIAPNLEIMCFENGKLDYCYSLHHLLAAMILDIFTPTHITFQSSFVVETWGTYLSKRNDTGIFQSRFIFSSFSSKYSRLKSFWLFAFFVQLMYNTDTQTYFCIHTYVHLVNYNFLPCCKKVVKNLSFVLKINFTLQVFSFSNETLSTTF